MNKTRPISWIKAAKKAFQKFPDAVQLEAETALTIAAGGQKADTAKPLKGFDDGVFELILKNRGDAFRVVYALKIGTDIYVVHAFQKKSKTGIKTPQQEINIVKERIKRLKEILT